MEAQAAGQESRVKKHRTNLGHEGAKKRPRLKTLSTIQCSSLQPGKVEDIRSGVEAQAAGGGVQGEEAPDKLGDHGAKKRLPVINLPLNHNRYGWFTNFM